MAASEHYFVEWKEQYVSKERGNRVVHYFLKDNSGESILAVVGTERSVRHMFYVVSDEFLSAHGADNSVHAGFRWRSRREVVNWLTSMLSKQHRQGDYAMSPKDDPISEVNAQKTHMPPHKGRLARNLKGHHLDISWSGSAWACGKQLKHYPAFRRNGISIAVQSFVFVMAEKENRYIAYLEDMYEDRKCQKKVKVRWFHHNKEVKGVVSLRNPHPKEVFITPYIQVISAECVDGPAIVLTHEHYEKCLAVFPHDLLGGVHFCFRQFKSNRIKPFKLSKLRGYFDQPIFSCFSPDFFEEEEFSCEDDVKVGAKRNRNFREHHKLTYDLSYKKHCLLSREPNFVKHDEGHLRHTPVFAINEKVEFLCQDSGIRGCWFRCTVLEVSRRQMKILYDDVKDEETCTNLEEWVPTYRLAKADKLGMRHGGRPTVRPAYPCDERSLSFEVGDPADAWWNDGWWEGVVSGTTDGKNGIYQIYIPGENLYLNIELKNLRVSRDWIGDRWADVEPNPNILLVLSATSMDTKLAVSSAVSKEAKSDNSPPSCLKVVTSHKLSAVEEENDDLAGMTLTNVPLKDDCTSSEQQRLLEAEEKDYYSNHDDEEEKENADYDLGGTSVVKVSDLDANGGGDEGNNIDDGNGDSNLVECEIAELKCEVETTEMLTEC
ncbi:protein AGENET DOMAIN (AGD)-CONTAINING P1 [Sesamum alatum]|uniref:Protein AGENET DOMAIN (AGD)-CONTAINING P1 n=1 Tax=Sesamum alatum TaxID=300844 RepID=A0AAE2CYV8_9LAMI|nr:protein AGENET DOMAIN (AGD)-CONTAINING P1 [Sesamum alatum]